MDSTLTLRLSSDDRDLLEQLLDIRSQELIGDGLEPTAASYLRGLIRRDATAKGVRSRVGTEPADNARPKP